MKKLLLSLLCLLLNSMLFAQTYRNGSGSSLNLRSEPSTRAEVVNSIPANAKVVVLEKTNSEWSKVEYKDQTGYVASKYLSQKNSQNQSRKGSKNRNSASAAYTTGIGIRFGGWESGLTVKHFIKNGTAIEGILSTGWHYRGTRITGLYEIQKPISGVSGLYWFYGVGGHLGLYNEDYWYSGDCKDGKYEYKGRWYNCDGSRATVGIDGILGLEYFFGEIPLTIGIDIKPSIDLIGWGSHFGDSAFSLCYVF